MTAFPQHEQEAAPGLVRPYARTRGRTRPAQNYALEALVMTLDPLTAEDPAMAPEHREIAALCRYSMSVAEVSALLGIPVGVARVLLGDMASMGVISIHDHMAEQLASSGDLRPDTALMERVLHGLQRL
jgi:hypothetical protein